MTITVEHDTFEHEGVRRREPTEQERRVTFWGLLIVFLLSALDQTIVATAMPRIVKELHGVYFYSWVTTSYLLASTVMMPIWGKLGDLHGRKGVLLAGIGIFVAGSWLCGLAGEFGDIPLIGNGMMQLIVARGLQGIGGGALFTTAFAIIADLFPPLERGRFASLFGAVYGLASVIGPVIGGWLTDYGATEIGGVHIAGWRWIFYVNLPTSLLALFMIAAKMPHLSGGRGGRIDYAGAALIVLAIGAVMLMLTMGPKDGWTSQAVMGCLALSLVTGAAFFYRERYVAEPILPLGMFKIRAFSAAMVSSALVSMAFMGTIIFVPLYLQIALGIKATSSGFTHLAMMMGLISSATASGLLVGRTRKYKPLLLAGTAIQFVGLFLMSQLTKDSTLSDAVWRMLVVGIGLGPSQSLFSVIAQNSVPPSQIGVATSTATFLRQIAGLTGVSIFGAIVTAELQQSFSATSTGAKFDLGQLQAIARLGGSESALVPQEISQTLAHAMSSVFMGSLIIVAAAFISISFIPNISLRGRGSQQASPAATSPADAA